MPHRLLHYDVQREELSCSAALHMSMHPIQFHRVKSIAQERQAKKVILGSISQNGLSIVTWLGGILLLLALFAALSVITMKTRKRLRLRRNPASFIEVISIEVATGMSSASGNLDPGYDSSSGEKDQVIPGPILGGHTVEQVNPEDEFSEERNESPDGHDEE